MEELLTPSEIRARAGSELEVAGWVHDVRILGGISFVLLRNSKGVIQVAAPKQTVTPDVLTSIASLHQEDVIRVRGLVKESKVSKLGFEIVPKSLDVLSRSATPLPLDPRGVTPAGLDTKLVWRSLDLRRPASTALFKVESAFVGGAERYLSENGFMRAFTPSILGGISEGGSEVFKIDYYGKPAFLRQDPQLHRQLVIAGGFDRIYDLGPNWRAELSHTPRHLCEHRTIAPEMAFISGERDTMRIEEGMLLGGMKEAATRCAAELDLLEVEPKLPRVPFPVLEFPAVYEILKSMGRETPRGADIDAEAGEALGGYVSERFGSDFFFLNRFPSQIKPFYVMKVDEEPEFAHSVDLMYKGLELSSGGQREHRYERIVAQIREKGLSEEGLKWFTEPFRYGVPPHGGFSFGIERFTAYWLGIENIKEAALFPRDPERLVP